MVAKFYPAGQANTPPNVPAAAASASVAVVQDAVGLVTHAGAVDQLADHATVAGGGFDHFTAVAPDAGDATVYGHPGDLQLASLALDPMAPPQSHESAFFAAAVPKPAPDDSSQSDASNAGDDDLTALLGPRSVDGIAVQTLGGFDHNHSAVFGGQDHYVPPPSYVALTNIPIPEFTAGPPESWESSHYGAVSARAEIAYDQAWLNNEQATLGIGFYDEGQAAAGSATGDASGAEAFDVAGYRIPDAIDHELSSTGSQWVFQAGSATASLANDGSGYGATGSGFESFGGGFDSLMVGNGGADLSFGHGFNDVIVSAGSNEFEYLAFGDASVSPAYSFGVTATLGSVDLAVTMGDTLHLPTGFGIGAYTAPAFALGTDGSVVLNAEGLGPETLSGGNAVLALSYSYGSPGETVTGGGTTNVLAQGDFNDTLFGGTGASDTNTFILNGGAGVGDRPHSATIENFNAAHDVIEIPAALYTDLGLMPITTGAGQNLFVLANDAAAQSYAGANAALLVVGSGQNADIYYYDPNGPAANQYNLGPSNLIAVVYGASAAGVESAIKFSLTNPAPPSASAPGYQLAALAGDHSEAAHHAVPTVEIHPAHLG